MCGCFVVISVQLHFRGGGFLQKGEWVLGDASPYAQEYVQYIL